MSGAADSGAMDRDTGAMRRRLHRDHDGKREVIVYDYVDRAVSVLARMAAKREKGYKALGYVLES